MKVRAYILFSILLTAAVLTGCSIKATVPDAVIKGGKIPLKVAVILPSAIDFDYQRDNGGWSGVVDLEGGVPGYVGNKMGYYSDGQKVGKSMVQLIKDGLPHIFEKVDFYQPDQNPGGYPLVVRFSKPKASVKAKTTWKRKEYTYTYKQGNFTDMQTSARFEAVILDKNGNRIAQAAGSGEKQNEFDEPLLFDSNLYRDQGYVQGVAFAKLVSEIRQGIKGSQSMKQELSYGECGAYSSSNTDLFSKLDEISARLASDARWVSGKRIAVVDIVNLNGAVTGFSKLLVEEMSTRLINKKAIVIERNLLDIALTELKLSSSDLFNQNSTKKFGELTGADGIVTGTVADMGQTVRINSRLIEPNTGRILAASGVEVAKTDSICRMLKQAVVAGSTGGIQESPSSSAPVKEKGKNLIKNGDFKNRYEGWEKTVGDEKGASNVEVARYSNSKSGMGLHIKHTGKGFIQFDQTLDVVDTDLVFSASFQATSNEGPMHAFSGTGISQIVIQYLDENEKALGQTSLVNYIKNPFADSGMVGVPRLASSTNTTHYVPFENGTPYRNYKIDINKELEDNLHSVNPKDIKKIAVAVWCSATDRRATTELWISDISLSYK